MRPYVLYIAFVRAENAISVVDHIMEQVTHKRRARRKRNEAANVAVA